MMDTTQKPRSRARRWIRIGFLAWAIVSTLWLIGSYRTQGVDRALLESDADVSVHRSRGLLAFRPAAADAPGRVEAMVLIGTSHPKSVDLSDVRLSVTKVYATNDGIATVEMIDSTRDLLPATTRWVEIQGGNHSQFGHYGRQPFDGSPAISREEQQAATRAALLEALQRAAAPGGGGT